MRDLTYQNALDIAIAMETATKDASELQEKHRALGITSEKETNIKKVNKFKTWQNAPQSGRKKPHVRFEVKNKKKCFRCLKHNHHPNECRFKNETCFTCQQKGHITRVCPGKRVHALESDYSDSHEFISSLEVHNMRKNLQRIPYQLHQPSML